MPRSERQVPSIYFGRPGALVTLPWPRGDLDKPYERPVFAFQTGSGQYAISTLPAGSRLISLNWNALHVESHALLGQYWSGANGTGPWALLDPSVPNLLLPNQAGATGSLNDATGFATTTGAANAGTLISSTAEIHRVGGSRSLRWQFPVAAASLPTTYLVPPYRNWYGVPVQPAVPYTFSLWAKPDGVVDSAISLAAKLQWYAADGTLLGDFSSGDIALSGWTRVHTSMISPAIPPANTAYARPILVAIGSTITTGASLYLDEFQLEQDSVANSWAPGTGARAVEIMSLTDRVPFESRMRQGVILTLRELAS